MPQYEVRHAHTIHKVAPYADMARFLRDRLYSEELSDVSSWTVSREGDLWKFTGVVTVVTWEWHGSSREALRMFLMNPELPDDIRPADITIEQLPQEERPEAVERAPAL